PAAELAGVAAAIGRAFTVDLLAAATELEEQEFIGALDELWRRGIVRAHGPNSYDFSHGRIRDAAYAALGPPRRRQAHLAPARPRLQLRLLTALPAPLLSLEGYASERMTECTSAPCSSRSSSVPSPSPR